MPKQRLKVDEVNGVTIVRFLDKRILEEATIQAIADQLFNLVEQEGRRKLLLHFGGVEYMSSAALGKLILLHKKIESAEGMIAMCCVITQIQDVLSITKLDHMFGIFPDETSALASFH